MAEHKTLHGILAMVDIVNFTGQATKLGKKYTAKYTDYFQEKVTGISMKYGFQVIKSIGDAALLFGYDVEGLLDIMLDLFHRDKPEDKYGFISRFRMVAHSGFFQFKIENGRPVDLVCPEGIILFRLEKQAQTWELVVTPSLYEGIKSLLTEKRLEVFRMDLREPLKGFDNREWEPMVYKLRIVKEQEIASNLLEPRLNQLENEVQYIPVFGNIYPPVPMEKNFINLSLVCDDDQFLKKFDEYPPEEREDNIEKRGFKKVRHVGKGEWPFHELDMEQEFIRQSKLNDIDVPTLYEKFRTGIIMGLPGAGKTTILRNIAYKEFKKNEMQEEGKKQVILFVPCGNAPLFDTWYKQYQGPETTSDISGEDALDFMTWVCLFGKTIDALTPDQLVEFRESTKRVKQAFQENRVTLLVDALDEAADIPTREKMKDVFMTLYRRASQNRLYLTSRPSESIHLAQDIKRCNIPLFKVLSLNMEQVRAVARNLLKEDSSIYKKFSEALWQEEVVVKMAATPITALLVTAYFQAYEKFDHRFPMYDLLIKFILLKAWENIKTGLFPYKNMELFFQEIKAPDFFDKHTETEILCDALASLCFKLFYEDVDGIVQRSVAEEVLNAYFTSFIKERMSYQYDDNAADIMAAQWRERFHRDHLLLQAGAGKYVFLHSTVMEFLAAYYIVGKAKKDATSFSSLVRQCVGRENFLELETVPIAAGSSLPAGYDVLMHTGDLVREVPYPERVYRLGVKCLSEVEWLLQKTYNVIRIKSMRKTIDDIVERNRLAVKWVYLYMKDTLLTEDKEKLKENSRQFESVLKLSRPTFLEEFLDYNGFDKGDSELVELRRQLLLKLAQKELVEKWEAKQKKETQLYDNVLQLDTFRYHPEDKNFSYYRELTGKELVGFFGSPNLRHSSDVLGCVFSPNGNLVLSASEDGSLKLWDQKSGREIRSFHGHNDKVTCCAFSADGKKVVSGSWDNTLRLWDVGCDKEIHSFARDQFHISSCAFSPNGLMVVSTSDSFQINLWDVESGRKIREFSGHRGYVTSCAFSPDGQMIVSGSSDNTIKLWDVKTGREILNFIGHKKSVTNCTFSPDGKTILSASEDSTLMLWDLKNGREIHSYFGHKSAVTCCAFSLDGKLVVSSSRDNTLKLWDAVSGKEIRVFTGHQGPVYSCAFSPGGGCVASGSIDHTLKLWDVKSGKEFQTLNGHQGDVYRCAVSPDGKWLLSAGYDHILKLWDIESGMEIRSFIGHQADVYSCAFSPDGERIVSSSWDNTIKLWDVMTGKEIRSFNGHEKCVISLAFSSDGGRVVSGSVDTNLLLWDVATGRQIRAFTRHKANVVSCSFSPNGERVLSGSWDNTIKLWNVDSGKEIRTFHGHNGYVTCCEFLPGGDRIVSGSADHTLKLWEVGSGSDIRSFKGHLGPVYSCAVSLDASRMVSCGYDKAVKIWDLGTGQCNKTLKLPWVPAYITLSPTSPWKVFTANRNGTVTVFEFDELK
ncbi:MAG: NACHT domain-containing protein [Candidatus Aminicenantes bacterium]|nr:NACHT domain-containing protein [Candidatus Aminicenantes bacterium]